MIAGRMAAGSLYICTLYLKGKLGTGIMKI